MSATEPEPTDTPWPALLAEYAYALRPGGKLYHITDVAELHAWMARSQHTHTAAPPAAVHTPPTLQYPSQTMHFTAFYL